MLLTSSPVKRERLSDLSRGVFICGPCFAGFGVESDEKFVSESNADDRFFLSLIEQARTRFVDFKVGT